MKREIKFKAWHKEEKILCDVTNLNSEGAFLVGVKKGADQYTGKFVVYAPEDGRFCLNEEIELLQYLGEKDKNGKEVYEGYVVEHEFETDYGPLLHRDTVTYCAGAFYPMCEKPMSEFEVIGNIYENPELI